MSHYTLLHALIGGSLIGFASLIAGALSGKVPGISGVFGRLFVPATQDPPSRELRRGEQGGLGDKLWRVVFLMGLIGGAALSFALWESAALFRSVRPLGVMAVAGLLVGFGTRLGKRMHQRPRRLRRRDRCERFDCGDDDLCGRRDGDGFRL